MKGIYKITSPENIVYIGQSINIEKRFKQHKYSAVKAKSTQKDLRDSYFKYGFVNHKLEVIHEFKFDVTREIMDEYEDLYIRRYLEFGFKLFNKKSGGVLTCTWSEELKKNASENFSQERKDRYSSERSGDKNWFYGKKHTSDTKKTLSDLAKSKTGSKNPKARTVLQYDLNGNFIAEFSTINEAAKSIGKSRQIVNSCCNGWNKSAGGFVFKYKFKEPYNKVA